MTKQIPALSIRILKTSTCNTLSGKSKLTYHIGVSPDSEILLRIYSNSSSGTFSREWIALKDIQTALDRRIEGQHVTAYLLQPLYKGKSVNTPAFLLAVLSQEKLVRVLKGMKRDHEILDPSGFIAKVEKLIASGIVGDHKTDSHRVGTKVILCWTCPLYRRKSKSMWSPV